MILSGTVVHGAGRGRTLGTPTLNLSAQPKGLDFGVYLAWLEFEQKKYSAILHWGPRPTFNEDEPILEVHLLGANVDLYGKEVQVEVQKFVREVRHFESPEALREQIQKDLAEAQAFFA